MEPPGPIPNPEVKRCRADGSWAKGPARVGRCQVFARLLRKKEPGVFLVSSSTIALQSRGMTANKVASRAVVRVGSLARTRGGNSRAAETRSDRERSSIPGPSPLNWGLNRSAVIRLGACFGFLGVALGALGAHGLNDLLVKNERIDTWETAVLYNLVHALALLILGLFPAPSRVACFSFAGGMVLFSGSLYVLALTNFTKLGMVTPFGGVAFLVGWGILLFRPGEFSKG